MKPTQYLHLITALIFALPPLTTPFVVPPSFHSHHDKQLLVPSLDRNNNSFFIHPNHYYGTSSYQPKTSITTKTYTQNYQRTSLHAITSLPSSSLPFIWSFIPVILGTLGVPFVAPATSSWYQRISLPSFTPPNKIFAPVWSTLYALVGYSTYHIRRILLASTTTSITFSQRYILYLAAFHYLMNLAWAPVFFGMKRLRLGHIINVLLVITIIPIIWTYCTIDLRSGLLLIPYFLWLSFATALSDRICALNPTHIDRRNGFWYNNAKLEDDIWKLRKEAARKVGL